MEREGQSRRAVLQKQRLVVDEASMALCPGSTACYQSEAVDRSRSATFVGKLGIWMEHSAERRSLREAEATVMEESIVAED
jgi:hypothetical protein